MKKLFPYILIITIIVQLLAPFNISGGIKDNFSIKSNVAEASDDITVTTTASKADTSVIVHVRVVWGKENLLTGGEGVTVTLLDGDKKILETQEVSLKKVDSANLTTGEKLAASVQTGTVTFSGLKQNTTYGIQTFASHQVTSVWDLIKAGALPGSLVMPDITFTTISEPNPLVFITESTSTTGTTQYVDVEEEQTSVNTDAILPVCEMTRLGETIGGCIARLLYWGVFQPTSTIFGLTGKLLDITVAYSVKDTSYRSSFVVEGWGVMRDFCNMFFIFILLYIAFATILNLNGVKTKEMIINVVIIGLLMNFSLFAVQVIVDTSNIIARIFYNQQTIVVGPTVNGVVQQRLGSHNEIKLSEAIVAKVNPQKLILKAKQIGSISTKFDTEGDSSVDGHISAKTSILVIILASIVNIVGLIAFLMSSLIFISRVVGLWIAMILAPIAFLSYTVPALQNIEMIGWKRWWPDTLKLAFLAPVFIFFLYLIVKFLDAGLGIDSTNSKTGLDFILGVIVPFVFIMILLMKAKDIAQKMSGTIGESVTNVMKKVGGAALGMAGGVALGGAAMAGRGLIGRGGSAMAQSGTLKAAEAKGGITGWGAKQLRNIGGVAGKGSFDVRATKLGAKIQKETGMDLGKVKTTGGFEKQLKDKVEKKETRAEQLKVGETEGIKQSLNKTEKDLQTLLNANKKELDDLDKAIEVKRQALTDANAIYGKGSSESKEAGLELANVKRKKKALREGKDYEGDLTGETRKVGTGKFETVDEKYVVEEEVGFGGTRKVEKTRPVQKEIMRDESVYKNGTDVKYSEKENTSMGTYIDEDGNEQKRTIDYMERVELKEKKAVIERENIKRQTNYAEKISKWGGRANKEAAHKIRMSVKNK